MKRVLTTIMLLALLCVGITPCALAAGIDLTYDLTVDGNHSAIAQTGDVITVTYTIHGSEGYTVNAIQNEIKYDTSFFQFVDGSVTVTGGTGKLMQKIAGPRVYMNDMLTSYDAEQLVGTFQLKVIAKSGSGKVESTECLAYNGDAMRVTKQNLTVTIQSSGSDSGSGSGGGKIPADVTDHGNGSATVDFPGSGIDTSDGPVRVSIPASDGNVVVATYSDGTQAILGKSLVENGTAYFLLDRAAEVKVIDNTKHFTDVADSAWYKSAVDFASSHELFNGVSATEFAPDLPMTRAMLVTVLHRLESEPDVTAANIFTDVMNGTWYTGAVVWGTENKIIEGYGDGRFGPEDNLTREQMATILYRYMKFLGMDVSARGDLSAFVDGNQVSSWALEAMQWAVGSGVITGKEGAVLDPMGNTTRAEVATMLMRLVGQMVKP